MRRLLLALAGVAGFALAMAAQEPKPAPKVEAKKLPRIAVNDPDKLKADVDFALQGEYGGEVNVLGTPAKIGVQAVATKGQFAGKVYPGGLPGDGYDGGAVVSFAGVREGAAVPLKAADGKMEASIRDGVLTFAAAGMNSLKKTERKSPTLGAKPPAGAVTLFGEPGDIDKWTGAKVVELSDGKYLGVGGRTKQKFQSFTLHLEFRLPWMPNSAGQERGNSGVYIQDRYEVQVLDSFGLPLADNECGGIYKESAPKLNMCFPPMTWQTYDIQFTAAKFGSDGKKTDPAFLTVKHNGAAIHEQLKLKSNTPGGGIAKEVPEPGALYLQNHGDPVVYRNVWLLEAK